MPSSMPTSKVCELRRVAYVVWIIGREGGGSWGRSFAFLSLTYNKGWQPCISMHVVWQTCLYLGKDLLTVA